jgi:RNA polymerase sigma-70 factor, ECF subfamily
MPAGRTATEERLAETLATMGSESIESGDAARACAQILESLRLVRGSESRRVGADVLLVCGELALKVKALMRAAEFLGASEALGASSSGASEADDSPRLGLAGQIQREIGIDRFRVARADGQRQPFDKVIDGALVWLEEVEAALGSENPSGGGSGFGAAQNPVAEELGTTEFLIVQAKQGNPAARDRLAGRFLPVLKRFAHGRLPIRARGQADTDDLVLTTVERALGKMESIDTSRKGGFLAYLRQALTNQIRDEIRRASRGPQAAPLTEGIASSERTPLDQLLAREAVKAYQDALSRLPRHQRAALLLRIEEGWSYERVADAIGSPSANAARMLVSRALERVAKSAKKDLPARP